MIKVHKKEGLNMKRGFTLIELLLVLGVIAILASIVIIAINPTLQLGNAQDAKRKSTQNQIRKALYQYLIDRSNFPNSLPDGEGNAKPICRYGTSDASCIDLKDLVDRDYTTEIPVDPNETNTLWTGYTVYQQVGRAFVVATHMNSP